MLLLSVLELVPAFLFFVTAQAASKDSWRSRVIYQLLTDRFAVEDDGSSTSCDPADKVYCGGTWKGIQSKLDYVQGMGFDAIWISPIMKNLNGTHGDDGQAYHGYWNTEFETLNSHFGTEDDLVNLITDVHSRGMYIMFDSIANSMAVAGPAADIDYSTLKPFNSSEYFHQFCMVNFTDLTNTTQIADCWNGDDNVYLADLDIESDVVSSYLYNQIEATTDRYTVDGYRVDAVKQMNLSFLDQYTTSASAFVIGEVFDYTPKTACPYLEHLQGMTNYPARLGMLYSFNQTGAGFGALHDLDYQMRSNCSSYDMSLLITFLENHDLPRFASQNNDTARAVGSLAFLMLWDGIPVLYYGQEQHLSGASDPYNREALWTYGYNTSSTYYQTVRKAIALRKLASADDDNWLKDQYQYLAYDNAPGTYAIVQKGNVLGMYTNVGSSAGNKVYSAVSNFDENTVITDIFSGKNVTVGNNGSVTFTVTSGMAQVYYPATKLTSYSHYLGAATTVSSVSSTTYPSSYSTITLGQTQATGSILASTSAHSSAGSSSATGSASHVSSSVSSVYASASTSSQHSAAPRASAFSSVGLLLVIATVVLTVL
ncbi:alpha-amylase [Schizosaccharomyces japonicus yFS275]|uniref:alpha-amylase n=1 Tax=Schizosaccharomyces japonicus (strain yFS275 / FY16936) TaxID=402676 RepID=B6JUZ7_SCHJY|nr:alpha-amylase [Schizosaccharomyces japonicus yFS275]EEB05101.1 alpha-amylase [Schizosaccharomyces japonicus yFS275]